LIFWRYQKYQTYQKYHDIFAWKYHYTIMIWVGQNTAPYIFLFIMLLYLFTFTDNIPCELKFCPTYIEAQTKLVCQQVVQKNYNRAKAPEHHYVTMAKHNSNAWLCLYPSKSSVQRRQSSKQLFSVPSVNLNYCF